MNASIQSESITMQVDTALRESVPNDLNVEWVAAGWKIVRRKSIGKTVVARLRSTLTEINMPENEIPVWLEPMISKLEQITGKKITVYMERDNFLPF